MMVPHGVRLEGSHEMVPVRIVSTVPSSRRTRWTPGWAAPSSLQKMRWVGEELSGQSAIMSTLGPRFVAADTTCARRPPANVTSAVGSLLASAALMLSVDEAASGAWTPKSCSARSFSNRSRNKPKSFLESSWASALAANMSAAAASGANIFCMATLLIDESIRAAGSGGAGHAR